jgi:hypothetical protein
MSSQRQAEFAPSSQSRIASLALAAVLTLAMLGGVNLLATSDSQVPQLAQATTQRA